MAPYDRVNLGPAFGLIQKQAVTYETKMWRRKYRQNQFRQLVKVRRGTDNAWAAGIAHYSSDFQGEARWLSMAGTDFPVVNIERFQHDLRIEAKSIGYDWHLQEDAQAKMIGYRHLEEKIMACRKVFEKECEHVFRNGHADLGWDGFLNMSRVTRRDSGDTTANPNSVSGAALKYWFNKTGKEVIADINNMLVAPWLKTEGDMICDTVLLPKNLYAWMVDTDYSDHHPTVTIMERLKQKNLYTANTGNELTVKYMHGLETAGQGGNSRIITYLNDEEVLTFLIPMPLRFFPAQRNLLRYVRPAIFRLGGLDVRISTMFRYFDGSAPGTWLYD